MIRKVMAVFDTASQLFGQPIFVAATGQAVRNFTDEVRRPAPDGSNPMNMHPEDFELWELGIYDDECGTFGGVPTIVVRGKDVSENVAA